MTGQHLLSLALRVTGFWLLIEAVGSTAQLVAMICAPDTGSAGIVAMVAIYAASYGVLAAMLLLCAPGISSWFYRGRVAGELLPLQVTPRDAYEICARVLGMYSFIAAIEPVGKVLPELFVPGFWSALSSGTWPWAYVVQTVAYISSGLFLVCCAPTIAAMFVTPTRGERPASKGTE